MPPEDPSDQAGSASAPTDLKTIIATLSDEMVRLRPGALAALRHCAESDIRAPHFWRWAARFGWPRHREAEWATIVAALAILTPKGAPDTKGPDDRPHDGRRPLGAVLFDGGDESYSGEVPALMSEARLARLLNMRGATRQTAVLRAARMLARNRARANCIDLARLTLTDDSEPARRIARAYYGRMAGAAYQATQHAKETA